MSGIDRNFVNNKLKTIPIDLVCERLRLESRNKRYRCVNPHHPDNNPSMVIYPRSNTWKCFACDAHGSVIDLVKYACNCEFLDACRWLAKEFAIPLPFETFPIKQTVKPQIKPKIKEKTLPDKHEPDTELLEWLVENSGLSDVAKQFLFDERKLSNEIVASCRLFSLDDKHSFISKLVNKFGEERCVKSRILSKGKYGLYTNYIFPSLAFPYYDYNGRIVNIQTRAFYPANPSERFRNIPGLPVLPFNLNSLKNLHTNSIIYIAEGVTDCLALLSEGKNAIAIPGANNFKEEFAKYLDDFILVMFPDNDKPGASLFEKIKNSVRSSIFRKILPDDCKDYADYHIKSYFTISDK